MENEIWRPIPEYETHYEVSNRGRVRRIISTAITHRKLREDQVHEIRSLLGSMSQVAIGARYGVSQGAITKIATGKCFFEQKPRNLKPQLDGKGYPFVNLSQGGNIRPRRVHQLVCSAFLGPPPPGHEVNHVDGTRTNARLDNLEYVTPTQNQIHAIDVLRNRPLKLSLEKAAAIRAAKGRDSVYVLAERYGVSIHCIRSVWYNHSWVR